MMNGSRRLLALALLLCLGFLPASASAADGADAGVRDTRLGRQYGVSVWYTSDLAYADKTMKDLWKDIPGLPEDFMPSGWTKAAMAGRVV